MFALIGAVLASVAGSYMQSSATRRGQRDQNVHDLAMARERGTQDRLTMQRGYELEDQYSQLNTKRRKEARAAMFNTYSKIGEPK